MTVNAQSHARSGSHTLETARALRKLYFTRTAFSMVWVTLVTLFAGTHTAVAAALLIIYPAWDVNGTFLDIRANRHSPASLRPQYINAAISILTTIAVGLALRIGVPEAVIVFGVWAILTGLIQLVLGISRRTLLGGQWPMIISGGQSVLGGASFIALAHDPTMGITSLAGYSAFGAFYYLLSAFRLSKTIHHKPAVEQIS